MIEQVGTFDLDAAWKIAVIAASALYVGGWLLRLAAGMAFPGHWMRRITSFNYRTANDDKSLEALIASELALRAVIQDHVVRMLENPDPLTEVYGGNLQPGVVERVVEFLRGGGGALREKIVDKVMNLVNKLGGGLLGAG